MDIAVWLRSLGLGQYEAVFRQNEIDDTVLPNLTAEDLKELGVASLGTAASSSMLSRLCVATRAARRPQLTQRHRQLPRTLNPRPRRAPPSHRDVLGLGRLNGFVGAHGP